MRIGAAVRHPYNNQKLYLFFGNKYVRYNMDTDNIDSGYPMSISSGWSGIPDNIDAILNHPSNPEKLYFFKGNQYYRYDWGDDAVDSGYPKTVGYGWDGIPDNIDAAFCHPTNPNKVYFFKGDEYYRYDWGNDEKDSGYPRSIDWGWSGIPNYIDAIVAHPTDRNKYYFFKGDEYYRYRFSSDAVDSGYPLITDDYWSISEDGFSKRLRSLITGSYSRDLYQKYIDAEYAEPRCKICKSDFHLNYKRAAAVLRVSGHTTKEISRAIVNVYRKVQLPMSVIGMEDYEIDLINSPTLLGMALSEAGFPPDDIVEGILDVMDVAPDPLYEVLSTIGVDDDDIKEVFSDLGEEFVDFGDSIGDVVGDAWDFITSPF